MFLFNAEEAKTRALLQETGLAGRVEVVGDLRSSDAILAVKLAKNGKHVNLTQVGQDKTCVGWLRREGNTGSKAKGAWVLGSSFETGCVDGGNRVRGYRVTG